MPDAQACRVPRPGFSSLLAEPSAIGQPATPASPLLEVRDLAVHFPILSGFMRKQVGAVRAVDGVSFAIWPGETLGLVGESGSGKSTVGRAVLQLRRPTRGSVTFKGQDLVPLAGEDLRRKRREFQMIFQDPYASLNPRMTVGEIVTEPFRVHGLARGKELKARAEELLARCGLSSADMERFPHEFSGGQRQRVGIARALALRPSFVVADEPISALDVSIQAQILNLLQDLQQQLGLTYLFISHDLHVVRHIAGRVAVMYLGKLVELAPSQALFTDPLHPYTQALLSAALDVDPTPHGGDQRIRLHGELPSPSNPPSGCRFRTRCPLATPTCATQEPPFRETLPGHWVACHYAPEGTRRAGALA
jgi:oligopeptide transport system ATP-binding protein